MMMFRLSRTGQTPLLANSLRVATLALVGALGAAAPSAAQDRAGGLVDIGVEAHDGLLGARVEIEGCAEFIRPSETGRELIFRCESRVLYPITVDGRPSFVGYQRLREAEPELRGQITPPLAGPLRLMMVMGSADEAAAAYDRLSADLRPQDLPRRAADAGAGQVALRPEAGSGQQVATTRPPLVLRLESPAALGALTVELGQIASVNGAAGDMLSWSWTLPSDSLPQTTPVRLAARADCRVDVSPARMAGQAVPERLAFPCISRPVALPASFAPVEPSCAGAEGGWRCILPESQLEIGVRSESWGAATAVLDGTGAFSLATASLRPAIPLVNPLAGLGAQSGRCAAPEIAAAVLGYCSAGVTCPEPGAAAEFGGDGLALPRLGGSPVAGPSLSETGWADPTTLPDSAVLRLTGGDGAETIEVIALAGQPVNALATLGLPDPTRRVPFDLSLAQGTYATGRELRVFAEDTCSPESRFEDVTKSLIFAGTETPDVPACAHVQVFDGEDIASACTPVAFDAEASRASAAPEIIDCGDKRLVIAVVENASATSGAVDVAIVSAIEALVRQANAENLCLPVDVVLTRGADREVLLKGENIDLAGDVDALWKEAEARFRFLGQTSEPFEDFNWIEREWGSRLGGLVLILDASKPSPTSPLDAPAAVLWYANQVFRWVLNTAGDTGCDKYRDVFRMENCEPIGNDFTAKRLAEIVALGLAQIQGEQ